MTAYSEHVTYVSEILLPMGPCKTAFFGGHAFKSNGDQFAVVMGNVLYFRVDTESIADYEQAARIGKKTAVKMTSGHRLQACDKTGA